MGKCLVRPLANKPILIAILLSSGRYPDYAVPSLTLGIFSKNVQFALGACTKLPSPFYHTLGAAGADHGAHCVLFE